MKYDNEEEDVFLDQDKVRMKKMLEHDTSVSECDHFNIRTRGNLSEEV